jgi:hypothetical protein
MSHPAQAKSCLKTGGNRGLLHPIYRMLPTSLGWSQRFQQRLATRHCNGLLQGMLVNTIFINICVCYCAASRWLFRKCEPALNVHSALIGGTSEWIQGWRFLLGDRIYGVSQFTKSCPISNHAPLFYRRPASRCTSIKSCCSIRRRHVRSFKCCVRDGNSRRTVRTTVCLCPS